MGPTKVFVGNLSFKTKEAELADEFSTVGKVLTANIITRGYRSLGYGFVEFEKEEDARNALNSLNKKNRHGREINVELATPRDEGAPRPPRQRRGNSGPPRGGRGGYPPREGGYPPREGGYAPREGGYPPREGGYAPREGGYPPREGGYAPREGGDSYNGENRRGSPRGRGGYRGGRNNAPSSPNVGDVNNSPINAGDQDRGGRDRGGPRRGYRRTFGKPNAQRSPPSQNRVPSTTTLFVANLPYQFSDDELLKLLPKASKAYVAKNYNGRSKGFGFVEFGNEDDQKAALAASEKLQAAGRDLIVKIALTEEKRPGIGPADVSSPAQTQ